jgi:hypothetical protein
VVHGVAFLALVGDDRKATGLEGLNSRATTLLRAGGWLLVVLLIAWLHADSPRGPLSSAPASVLPVWHGWLGVLSFVGTALATVGASWKWRIDRWIALARRGEVPRYRVVSRDQLPEFGLELDDGDAGELVLELAPGDDNLQSSAYRVGPGGPRAKVVGRVGP